ncbi:MAG: hypothetical protein ACK53C_14305 [Pseudomonadota bacterium]
MRSLSYEVRSPALEHAGLAPDVLDRTDGLGLLGASERLRALGGRLEIARDPRGAHVVASLPLEPRTA